jgi:type I restriction enzyme S subunit
MVKVNDLLLVQRGSLGKAVLIDKDFGPMTINPSMILITKFNEEPKFLWYQFQSNLIQNVVESIKQATAVPMISQENVKEFRLLLPIKSEQQQISDFLDKQTAKIDSLISITQIQIEKLQEFRQSLISAAVTGKIDVRTNHEEVN